MGDTDTDTDTEENTTSEPNNNNSAAIAIVSLFTSAVWVSLSMVFVEQGGFLLMVLHQSSDLINNRGNVCPCVRFVCGPEMPGATSPAPEER